MIPSEDDITLIGETNFRNVRKKFGIKRRDRRQHMYIIGKTGVGKSTLLLTLIAQDIARGEGVAIIDPHGDLASRVLSVVPPCRSNDVVNFDPSDSEYPIALNLLEVSDAPGHRRDMEKQLVASGLISVLKKLWADSWGPRMEYILRNTVLALLETPGTTLLAINRMFTDELFREQIVRRVADPLVKAFWTEEFVGYSASFRSEAVSPIQNKIGQFLSNNVIRNIVGQSRSTINIKEIMNRRQILVANLAKGKVGEDCSALLGATLVTKLQLAAMSRTNLPEEERCDFYAYVDEFQNFATDSFDSVLSEARKYRLNLTMAHQYVDQLPLPLRDAVFGNVGTLASFRVGAADTRLLQKEFAPEFADHDMIRLDNYQAYIRMVIDGTASKPFSMITTPVDVSDAALSAKDKLTRASRERYAVHRAKVEEAIGRWLGYHPVDDLA